MSVAKILLDERNLKGIANTLIESNSINIKAIKFFEKEGLIDVKASVKKVFSLDAKITLRVKSFDKDKITLEIKKLTSLKIDLFSMIEKSMEGRSIGRFKNKGIIINGKEIIVDGNKIFKTLKLEDGLLEDIKILDKGLLMSFTEINEDKLLALKEIG